MIPSPFTEVGRLYSDFKELEHKVNSKANDYEVNDLKHKISQLSSEITFLTNQLHYLSEAIQGLKDRE